MQAFEEHEFWHVECTESVEARVTSYHSVQNLLVSNLLSKSIENYNFPCCFLLVYSLFSLSEGGT